MTNYPKVCPRCRGQVFLLSTIDGDIENCLQCGCNRYLDVKLPRGRPKKLRYMNGKAMRQCCDCQQFKPATTEYFYSGKQVGTPQELDNKCKDCRRAFWQKRNKRKLEMAGV